MYFEVYQFGSAINEIFKKSSALPLKFFFFLIHYCHFFTVYVPLFFDSLIIVSLLLYMVPTSTCKLHVKWHNSGIYYVRYTHTTTNMD